MINVPPKQQEQMAGCGSGHPPWIRRFILESCPAIGSSSRRLRKGGVVDDSDNISRSTRQRGEVYGGGFGRLGERGGSLDMGVRVEGVGVELGCWREGPSLSSHERAFFSFLECAPLYTDRRFVLFVYLSRPMVQLYSKISTPTDSSAQKVHLPTLDLWASYTDQQFNGISELIMTHVRHYISVVV
jgi:hypothetical protein